MNDQEGSEKEKVTQNIFQGYLCLHANYKYFAYFIFNILSSSWCYVFISAFLRPQELESLKRVYGLTFSYLLEDEKLFCTRCFANGKGVIVCGDEIPM